jgi:hypothetical protein
MLLSHLLALCLSLPLLPVLASPRTAMAGSRVGAPLLLQALLCPFPHLQRVATMPSAPCATRSPTLATLATHRRRCRTNTRVWPSTPGRLWVVLVRA